MTMTILFVKCLFVDFGKMLSSSNNGNHITEETIREQWFNMMLACYVTIRRNQAIIKICEIQSLMSF